MVKKLSTLSASAAVLVTALTAALAPAPSPASTPAETPSMTAAASAAVSSSLDNARIAAHFDLASGRTPRTSPWHRTATRT